MAGRQNFGGISQTDFDSLLQALCATSKGRSFLDAYRRQCQPDETLGVLDSLQRIEKTMAGVRDQLQPERIAGELRHIAMTLDIALDGVSVDPDGSETERRYALIERARREIATLAESVLGDGRPPAAEAGQLAFDDAASER